MKIPSRFPGSISRAGAAIALGVVLAATGPTLEALGHRSPPSRCEQILVGARSRIVAIKSRLVLIERHTGPVGLESHVNRLLANLTCHPEPGGLPSAPSPSFRVPPPPPPPTPTLPPTPTTVRGLTTTLPSAPTTLVPATEPVRPTVGLSPFWPRTGGRR